MASEFDILHALRVKGLAQPAVLSALAGVAPDELAAACAPLVERGDVLHRKGAIEGYMLTPTGKAAAQRLLADDPQTENARAELEAFDARFLPINTAFKEICHRWQVRPDGTPNDHSDGDYDGAVIAELVDFHTGFVGQLGPIGERLPRIGRYAGRLDAALERIQGGDTGAFARPLYDSYHDIWMELHNDVVLSLGRERGAADEQAG